MKIIHTKYKNKLFQTIFLSGFLVLTFCSNNSVFANHEVDFSATIAPSLQVIIPSDKVILNLVPEAGSAVFTEEDFSVIVATNNPTGYQLTLESGTTDLTRTEADNFGNFATLKTLETGTYTEDTFTVNRWGYKKDGSDYLPFSTNISLSSSTVPTNAIATNLTFGAKVDMNQQAGTYKLALNFQAVSNIVPGVETITFNGNGADGGTISFQQIEAGKSAELSANAFTRTDYNFLGWSTTPTGTVEYADKASYSVKLSEENTAVTLYAVWEEAVAYMQTYTLEKCQAEATNAPVTLIDKRDDNEYTVRYIAGNCWMTQNLRLAPGKTIYSTDSNISASSYTITSNASFDGGDYDTPSAICSSEDGFGCYYDYISATAGTIVGDSNINESTNDICPKGWKLPTRFQIETLAIPTGSGNSSTKYYDVFTPVLNGRYGNGSQYNVNVDGCLWTSTILEEDRPTYRYCLYPHDGRLYMGADLRTFGFSIRCVKK